jgi:hypothetical protein
MVGDKTMLLQANKSRLLKVVLPAIGFFVFVSGVSAAWNVPLDAPPGGNVVAPLNENTDFYDSNDNPLGKYNKLDLGVSMDLLGVLQKGADASAFVGDVLIGKTTIASSGRISVSADASAGVARDLVTIRNTNTSNGNFAAFMAFSGSSGASTEMGYVGTEYTLVSGQSGYGFLKSNGAGLFLSAWGSSGVMRFLTGGQQSGNERMRIDSNGYIGISTTTPNVKLVVGSGVGDGNIIGINGADDRYTGLRLSVANNEQWFIGMNDTASNNDLIFKGSTTPSVLISKNNGSLNVLRGVQPTGFNLNYLTSNWGAINVGNTNNNGSAIRAMNWATANSNSSAIDAYSFGSSTAIKARSAKGWSGEFSGGQGFYVDKICIGASANTAVCKTSWASNATPTLAQVLTAGSNASSYTGTTTLGGKLGIGTSVPNSVPNKDLHIYNTTANAEIDLQSVAGSNRHWGIYVNAGANAGDNSFKIWQTNDRLILDKSGNLAIPTGSVSGRFIHATDTSFDSNGFNYTKFNSMDGRLVVGVSQSEEKKYHPPSEGATLYAYNDVIPTVALLPNQGMTAVFGKSIQGHAGNFVNGDGSQNVANDQSTIVVQHLSKDNTVSAVYAENYSIDPNSKAVYASSTSGWAGYFTGGASSRGIYAKQICLGGQAPANCKTSWPSGSGTQTYATPTLAQVLTAGPNASGFTGEILIGGGLVNVGIGTTKAIGALHVNSGTNGKTALFERSSIGNNNTLNEAIRLMTTKTTPAGNGLGSSVGFYINDNETPSPSPLGAIGAVMANNDKNTGNLVFRPSNNGYQPVSMVINYLGDVGIGTDSPNVTVGTVLHIKSNNNAELDLQSGSNSHWGVYQQGTDDTNTANYDDTGDLRFWQDSNRVVFGDNGRVGIGTANLSKNYKLIIGNGSGSGNNISVNGATGNYVGTQIAVDGTEKWFSGKNNTENFVIRANGNKDFLSVDSVNNYVSSSGKILANNDLEVTGRFRFTTGNNANTYGYVLTSDPVGNATWLPPAAVAMVTSSLTDVLNKNPNASSVIGGVSIGNLATNPTQNVTWLDVGGTMSSKWIHATQSGINYMLGYLGIGTTDPKEQVHIKSVGSNNIAYNLQIQNPSPSSGSAGLLFSVNSAGATNDGSSDDYGKGAIVFERNGNYGIGKMHFLNAFAPLGNWTKKPTIADDAVMTIVNDRLGAPVGGDYKKRVGVSTTSPAYNLSLAVNGNVGATQYCDANGANCKSITDLTAGSSLWTANGGNIYRNSGNVGIGTTNPLNNLQIGDQSGSQTATPLTLSLGGTYSSVAGANLKLKLYDAGSAVYGFGVSASSLDSAVPSNAAFNWYINGGKVVTISPSGNVGIGSSTPSVELVVQGNKPSGDGIIVKTDGTGSGFVKVFNSSNNGGGLIAYAPATNRVGFVSYPGSAGVNIGAQDPNGSIKFLTGGSATTHERMFIASDGNVGIGTTTPVAKLEVNGDIIISGASNHLFVNAIYGRSGTAENIWLGDNNDTIQVLGQLLGKVSSTQICLNGTCRSSWPSASTILPAGTSGQTLRYDGSVWAASSILYNNGSDIGIGTTTPGAKLHVLNTASSKNSFLVEDQASDESPFVIDASGNVGIGAKTVPSGIKLYVEGVASFGVSTFNSNITVTGISTFNNEITVNSTSKFNGNIKVTGTSKFEGNMDVTGDMSVTGKADLGYDKETATCNGDNECTAICKTNYKVVGGGCNSSGGKIEESYPGANGDVESDNSWHCHQDATSKIIAYAICLRVE